MRRIAICLFASAIGTALCVPGSAQQSQHLSEIFPGVEYAVFLDAIPIGNGLHLSVAAVPTTVYPLDPSIQRFIETDPAVVVVSDDLVVFSGDPNGAIGVRLRYRHGRTTDGRGNDLVPRELPSEAAPRLVFSQKCETCRAVTLHAVFAEFLDDGDTFFWDSDVGGYRLVRPRDN